MAAGRAANGGTGTTSAPARPSSESSPPLSQPSGHASGTHRIDLERSPDSDLTIRLPLTPGMKSLVSEADLSQIARIAALAREAEPVSQVHTIPPLPIEERTSLVYGNSPALRASTPRAVATQVA